MSGDFTAPSASPPRSTLRAYAESIALAALLAILVRVFVVQGFKIPSASMSPTLQVGDHVLINKLRYGLRRPVGRGWLFLRSPPVPGDVVVFLHPVDRVRDYVKRVIAVAGEVVEIRDKQIFVNGALRDSPRAYFADGREGIMARGPRDNFGPVRVPPHHLFVLGDNRDRSEDSRFWGFVDLDDVEGKAAIVYWSWDRRNRWVRWERLGMAIE